MMDLHMEEDSSTFLQWAMNQLQHHQHPAAAAAAAVSPAYQQQGGGAGVGPRISGGPGDQDAAAAAAFPSLQALRASQPQTTVVPASVRVRDLTVQVGDYGLTNSGSSSDSPGAPMDHAAAAGWSPHTARSRTTGLGGGSNSRPVSWNFSAASALPAADDRGAVGVALPDATAAVARVQQRAASSAGRRGGSAGTSAAAAAASSPGPVQDHIIAERRRREKINQRFIELSTVIPGLKKMDKATILGDAVKYVRELQDKVKTLEEDGAHNAGGSIQSAVLVTKQQCHMSEDEAMVSSHGGGGGGGGMLLPEIEARLSEKSVLLRIHCYSARGLLVRVISEVEQMQLSITHTNVMPFPASTAIITITAKMMDLHMEEDSSTFLQWAMNQLQHHQHPAAAAAAAVSPAYQQQGGGAGVGPRISGGPGDQDAAAAAAFPSLQALRASQPQTTVVPASVRVRDLTVQVGDYGLTNSGSSSDSPGAPMDHAAAAGWSPHTARSRTTGLGGGSNSRPVSWNFSAASALPAADDRGAVGVALPDATAAVARVQQRAASSAGRRGGSAGTSAAAAAASSPGPVQDHIIAERRRREKINQRFIELSTVIPGLKKMDKATILGDAVKYVRELQDKVKTLEEDGAHNAGGSIQSAVLVTKQQCHMSEDEAMASSHGGGGGGGGMLLPEIEARLSEKSVLLRIHCYSARGLLVRVISEVEQMQLSITHTNVMPFPASTAIITITAKVEEGFNATVDEIVRRINSVLHQHYSSSSEETRG